MTYIVSIVSLAKQPYLHILRKDLLKRGKVQEDLALLGGKFVRDLNVL